MVLVGQNNSIVSDKTVADHHAHYSAMFMLGQSQPFINITRGTWPRLDATMITISWMHLFFRSLIVLNNVNSNQVIQDLQSQCKGHIKSIGTVLEKYENRRTDGENIGNSSSHLVDGEGVEHGDEIGDDVLERRLLGLRRRVRQPVPAVIRCERAEPGLSSSHHLVPPRLPYLREPVQEDDHVGPCSNNQERKVKGTQGAIRRATRRRRCGAGD